LPILYNKGEKMAAILVVSVKGTAPKEIERIFK